jgi:hypothetical protein
MNQELEDIKLKLHMLIRDHFDVEMKKLNSVASSILAKNKHRKG